MNTNLENIKWKAEQLVALAKQVGVVLTIETVPSNPLAMGNFEMRVEARPARQLAGNVSPMIMKGGAP